MKTLYASKDTRALCPECGDHLFTFNKDIYESEKPQITDIYLDRGQIPFFLFESLVCNFCSAKIDLKSIELDSNHGVEPFRTWCDYCGSVIKASTTNINDLYNEMCDDCHEQKWGD